MSDQDDRQVPFWRQHHSAVMGCILPQAHQGVSAGVMRAVWNCYAAHVNEKNGGLAYPSRDRVAAITGFSTKQVSRAFAALVDSGWLEVVQPARQRSTDVCRVIIQGGHGVLSEVYPDIQTRHHVSSEVPSGVLPEVQSESRGDTESSRPDFEGSQGGHHVPLTILTKKELVVEDAREDDDATNTPQQVVKDTKKPSRLERAKELLATNDTEDMARGIYLIAKSCSYKLNEGDCSTIAFSLQFAEYSVEEIIQYVVEKIGYHHDKTSNLLTSFITKDASVWLLESRERARAIGVYDGPTYRRMELPDEPEEVKEPEPELTEEQKQKIRDDFDRMMREGIDPFAVRMS